MKTYEVRIRVDTVKTMLIKAVSEEVARDIAEDTAYITGDEIFYTKVIDVEEVQP